MAAEPHLHQPHPHSDPHHSHRGSLPSHSQGRSPSSRSFSSSPPSSPFRSPSPHSPSSSSRSPSSRPSRSPSSRPFRSPSSLSSRLPSSSFPSPPPSSPTPTSPPHPSSPPPSSFPTSSPPPSSAPPPSAGKRCWTTARHVLFRFSLAAFICLALWNSLHALGISGHGFLFRQQQLQHHHHRHQQLQPLPLFCAQNAIASTTAFASQGSHTLQLPANSFSFVEAAGDVGLAGSVYVRTAPVESGGGDGNDGNDSNDGSNGSNNVTVEYDIVASAPELLTFTVSRSGSVKMHAVGGSGAGWGSRLWRRWRHPRPQHECVTARITITLPARLGRQPRLALALATTTLPVELADSLALHSLQVTTRHGNVHSLARVASSTSVVLRSGSISGTFDWGRLLQLETLAGAITTAIRPLDSATAAATTQTTTQTTATMAPSTVTTPSRSLPNDADNAVLLARTVTGSIALSLAPDAAPPPRRNYSSTVATTSGAISGTYLFGSSARFSAAAGSIHATLLPVDVHGLDRNGGDTGNGNTTAAGNATAPARLATEAKHGSTTVRFSRPLGRKRVEGRHTAVTGRIEVHYPHDWQGQVSATATVGDVDVTGSGVTVTKRAWGVVEAVKGGPALGRIDARSDVGGVLVSIQ